MDVGSDDVMINPPVHFHVTLVVGGSTPCSPKFKSALLHVDFVSGDK